MQGVASLVVMPHKTTGAASSTEVTTGEQSPASLSNPTDTKATEGIFLSFCY